MGGPVKLFWEKQAPYVYEMRKMSKNPRIYNEWEYLYNVLLEYAKKNPELQILDTEGFGVTNQPST